MLLFFRDNYNSMPQIYNAAIMLVPADVQDEFHAAVVHNKSTIEDWETCLQDWRVWVDRKSAQCPAVSPKKKGEEEKPFKLTRSSLLSGSLLPSGPISGADICNAIDC